MIAIHFRFSRDPRAGGEAPLEWPPSTTRFLHALTSVYHHGRPAGVTAPRFRHILSHLSTPPHFFLPGATRPPRAPGGTDRRPTRAVDRRVRPVPASEMVWWWTEAELAGEDRAALDALLGRLPIHGGLDRWIEATLLAEGEAHEMLEADVALAGEEPVRVLLKESRVRPGGKKTRALVDCLQAGAGEGAPERRAESARSGSSGPSRAAPRPRGMQMVRYAFVSGEMPRVEETLHLAEHAREALIWLRAPAGHSPVITGKEPDGRPLEGHGHAHYLPTDEDGDGLIDHLTLFASDGFDPDDLQALLRFHCLTRREMPDLRLELLGMGEPSALRDVPLFGPARRWRSVTPFSLPWFASRGAGKRPRPRDLPDGQLRRALALSGFPEPVRIEPRSGYGCAGGLEVPWGDFAVQRPHKGTRGHGVAGYELEFSEPLAGPLAIGFAAHFGLGLFLPLLD